jgi:type I restriction enzyme S subunit
MGVIENLNICAPPLPEQRAIAGFLDLEVGKIDALVEEQRRLIALLAEKRRAVISHAVTRGLNPAAPLKPSGVDWLGDVPAHWEVMRLGALFTDANEPGEESLPILSVSIHTGVSDEEHDPETADRKVTRSEDRTKYKRVRPDDLTYNMMRAWQGGFGSVTVNGMVSPAYVVARPMLDKRFVTSFIEGLLRTPKGVEEMRRRSYGVTDFRLRLYWDGFKTIEVPLPPLSEQRAIAGFLDQAISKMALLSAEADCAIALLLERRAALISAAVTGKIDVRALES